MSDDEFMMDDNADEEEYDFDYDDDEDDAMDDGEGDVENQYYKAKSLKEDNAEAALKAFRTIVDDEPEKGEWGFKALKQMTKMNYLHLGRPDEALTTYRELLGYTKSHVTRNYAEKSINNILDYVGGEGKHASISPKVPLDTLEEFYSATKVACDEAKNERLSTKSNLKLAKLWLDRKEYDRLKPILSGLRETCRPTTGSSSSEDQTKGSLSVLEVYAIEIQMYSDLKETRKLKEIYAASTQVKNAIPHPRIMGVIRECGGKMWMMEKAWEKASTDLFESFRQYDESGSPQRIQVLKYLVLTYMLMGSEINPFDSQETKPYKNDPQIVAMTGLVSAYQDRDVQEAERILKANRSITADPFIQIFIEDLLKSLRTQYIVDIIKPYTRLELDYLAKTLSISRVDAEGLVVSLILDRKIKGKIDQVNGLLILERFNTVAKQRYDALDRMATELNALNQKILSEKISREHNRAAGWGGTGLVSYG